MDERLERIWRRCLYQVTLPGGASLELRVGARAPALDEALPPGTDTWAYVTAHNPGGVAAAPVDNARAERALDLELARLAAARGPSPGLPVWSGAGGRDPEADAPWPPEPSRLVLAISLGEAHTLARRFGQRAFLFGARGAPAALVGVSTPAEELSAGPPLDTVAWVSVDASSGEGRVLMGRPRGKPLYFMPGGKKEPGESDVAALVRELKEELDVAVDARTIEALFVVEAPAWGRTDTVVRMGCYAAQVVGEPVAAAEIEELAWLGAGDGARMPPAGRLVVERLLEEASGSSSRR